MKGEEFAAYLFANRHRCCRRPAPIQVTFSNYAAGEWVLDWAGEASEGDLTPEMGGPLVCIVGMVKSVS